MQTTAMRTAPLSSKARIGGLKQLSSPRMAAVCRVNRRVVAFKEDDKNFAEKARQNVTNKLPDFDGVDVQNPLGQEQQNYKPYKAVADESIDGPARLFPAFTRRREHTVGRLAMLGCAFAWAGEVMTGTGPMQQYANILSVPYGVAFWSTIFLATAQLFFGLSTESPTQSRANKQDIDRRDRGFTGVQLIEPDTPKKANSVLQQLLRTELALGRSAMLIFLGVMLVENALNGQAPLAHFGLITPGVPLTQAPGWLQLSIATFVAGGLGAFSFFGQNKDPEVY
ncbi:hypothetical protein N2152v2_011189 [Parachlorella kessleri]